MCIVMHHGNAEASKQETAGARSGRAGRRPVLPPSDPFAVIGDPPDTDAFRLPRVFGSQPLLLLGQKKLGTHIVVAFWVVIDVHPLIIALLSASSFFRCRTCSSCTHQTMEDHHGDTSTRCAAGRWPWRHDAWLRTTGVNTDGAAAKVMTFDRLGEMVHTGTLGNIEVG